MNLYYSQRVTPSSTYLSHLLPPQHVSHFTLGEGCNRSVQVSLLRRWVIGSVVSKVSPLPRASDYKTLPAGFHLASYTPLFLHYASHFTFLTLPFRLYASPTTTAVVITTELACLRYCFFSDNSLLSPAC